MRDETHLSGVSPVILIVSWGEMPAILNTFVSGTEAMTFFETNIPDFLTDKRNTTGQLIFTSLFALVFINIYSPFGVDKWNLTQLQLFFYSSLVILAGLLIIAISRIIMHQVTRKKRLSNGNYILWIAAEIVSLSAVYVLLQYTLISPSEDIVASYQESLKVTTLVLLLPYTLSYLYFSWMEKNRRIEQLSRARDNEKPYLPHMLPFMDEKGELRFSIKSGDFLYLEAADNYVIIHYLNGKSHEKFMVRNTLKNMELQLKGMGVIRCHRSFMVNFSRVKIVKKEKDGLVLEIDSPGRHNLPISETYVKEVLRIFSSYDN
ncbi:MAG: LytTR family transcriptional regulator DNA-binding domain-containing protein [Bacteroidales bacterium]|nr:LytTR family transcriptional regulator DNA-binding domain-containing protein [Bacteroidales bacterium]